MRPSLTVRPARFSALATPRLRSSSMAESMSPFVSSSTFLQSIMPAPVRWRSSETSFAVIVFVVVICVSLLRVKAAEKRSGGFGNLSCSSSPHTVLLGGGCFRRFSAFGGGTGLHACRDRVRLRATPTRAPPALALLVLATAAAGCSRFGAAVRRVGRLLAFLHLFAHRRFATRF